MLTIQNDPAGITGRQRHQWDYSTTIQRNIEAHLAHGGDCDVSINGARIDPRTDERMDMLPLPGDMVTVTRRPAGLETWAYVALAALTVYTYSQMPKPVRPVDTTGKDSPNNQLTGQTNVARAYQALPDVYGLRRVWPDLIQSSVVEYIDHVKYVTEWLCISRGLGTVTEAKYADTLLPDTDFEVFSPDTGPEDYPELNTTTLTDVVEVFNAAEVNGQEMRFTAPGAQYISRKGWINYVDPAASLTIRFVDGAVWDYMKSVAGIETVHLDALPSSLFPGWDDDFLLESFVVADGYVTFTFENTPGIVGDIDNVYATVLLTPFGAPSEIILGPYILPHDGERIRWNAVFLRGLTADVEIQVDWWQVDEDGDLIVGTDETMTRTYPGGVGGFDQRFFTDEVTPTAGLGRYAVKFERLNAPAADGSDVAKLESVGAVRHYPTKEVPGVTVMRVTTKATTDATGGQERKFNCMWSRHVRELDSVTLSASRNFARAMAHLWCVAGESIDEIDTTTLQGINDALGEDSELLRFDGSLDDADVSLGERMQLVANAARCQVWRDGTVWTVTRDQARETPEIQLDYRNLAAGGESAISYAAHLPASHDGIELEYVDETTQAKKAYIRLDISTGEVEAGASANPLKIKLAGCATEAQADNRAQLEARRLLYQRTSVQDTALADAGALGVGSLVRWIDPNDFAGDDGLQAGEVMTIDGSTITTSEPLDWKGEVTGRILFTGVDGAPLGAAVVCTPSGDAVTLASVPAGLYVRSISRQLGSRYAFSVGLSEAETEAAGLYVVTEIMPAADRTVALSLASYDDRMYSED